MPHDLKALALAAMEATAKADYFRQERVFNDDRAYWFMIEHDAWEAYRKAATPQRILQYRNEVLEEAAQVAHGKGDYTTQLGDEPTDDAVFQNRICWEIRDAIRSLKKRSRHDYCL